MFVDLRLELSKDFVVDVKQHSDSEQKFVVVSVKMLPVAFVQEHLRIVLLFLSPGGTVRDGSSSRVLGLLPLPTSGNWCRQSRMALGHFGAAKLFGSDQVPNKSFNIFITSISLKTVDQRETNCVLKLIDH